MHTLEQLRAGELRGVQRLQLACGLTEFPDEIFELADTLEILDLSGNALSALPADLARLSRLRIIFCSDNQFTDLPEVLGSCAELSMIGFKANRIARVSGAALPAKLRWLVLTDNLIPELPPQIGNCRQLQKLMLAGNKLKSLPAEMAACINLELLRIAANEMASLPAWLLELPRLSWLAYAGNPFCAAVEAQAANAPIVEIPWNQFTLKNKLGEGASGHIYRAECGTDTVAVKIFKGAVTSDGLPDSEMAACIGAGAHASLLPVLGKVPDHPQGAHVLVMPLIPPDFANLAGPPSLASCTRDTYPDGKRFTLGAALAIAHGIASSARQLHARGIMHGDLYGHNVLHCNTGRALLGDFGAASFFEPGTPQARALQALEVRAFGCLLEELLERCDRPVPAELSALQAACWHADAAARPLFDDIERRLSGLRQAALDNPF
ncbi:leucine-rich repeat-containing protein kinase family protein [Pseudoduganella sp. LjRoot289]|uniref:leucine-rich repeat-containing protein kinase family protein n=1 Tax=Pseudoduganella sp. LjRoot289 TaxID=3342314 RepID=UPI003ECCF24A